MNPSGHSAKGEPQDYGIDLDGLIAKSNNEILKAIEQSNKNNGYVDSKNTDNGPAAIV